MSGPEFFVQSRIVFQRVCKNCGLPIEPSNTSKTGWGHPMDESIPQEAMNKMIVTGTNCWLYKGGAQPDEC